MERQAAPIWPHGGALTCPFPLRHIGIRGKMHNTSRVQGTWSLKQGMGRAEGGIDQTKNVNQGGFLSFSGAKKKDQFCLWLNLAPPQWRALLENIGELRMNVRKAHCLSQKNACDGLQFWAGSKKHLFHNDFQTKQFYLGNKSKAQVRYSYTIKHALD